MSSTLDGTIGFLGCGKMAQALIQGIHSAGLYHQEKILASGGLNGTLKEAGSKYGISCCANNIELAKSADIIVLSVKPNVVPTVLRDIAGVLEARDYLPLVISVVAGVGIERIADQLGGDKRLRICRVMPNTPSLVQRGASAFCLSASCTEKDEETVQKILRSVGVCVKCPEYQLSAVTGVSGSGPAYVFMAIEAMADGGVLCGLPRDVALKLAAQTFLGAAQMVLDTGMHPGELKDAVTSPAGTTIAAVRALENNGYRSAMMEAVHAAYHRSEELGRK